MEALINTIRGIDSGTLALVVVVLTALVVIQLILSIVQLCRVGKMKKRLDRFTTGADGKSLEKDIVSLYEDNKFLRTASNENKKNIRTLYRKLESAYQKMGLVKYDAFNQMGGQLSFCLVLLDENNNGFLINSVHSTEGCYSYTKEIRGGECAISLGNEEEEALKNALNG